MPLPADPAMQEIAPEGAWLRGQLDSLIEPAVLLLLIGTAAVTALAIPGFAGNGLLSPLLLALLLVANLLPAMALLVLIGRRIAKRRARRRGGGDARLHTRLVALFSITAAAPTLIVVVMASFLFQSGMDFWFSERSRGMFENAVSVAQNYLESQKRDVGANSIAMATDLRASLTESSIGSSDFDNFYVQQVVVRQLSQSAIVQIGDDGIRRTIALIDPDNRPASNLVPEATLRRLTAGEQAVVGETSDGVEAVVELLPERRLYLYASRGIGVLGLDSVRRARSVFADYNQLFARSRDLQFRFVLALYFGALILVGLVIVVAIIAADRIVAPINDLVTAARRVAQGNLEERVKLPRGEPDEIATLGSAFNQMTERLGEQTRDLLAANELSENRRALIEAVLSSVASGVIAIDPNRRVRLMNAPALRMLGRGEDEGRDTPLRQIAPELDRWVDENLAGGAEPILSVAIGNEQRVWAVKRVDDENGSVLTFEDITQQLNDQRRAAWADVARRVAHEIKNPLTPIQLAAERLQRKFGKLQGDDQPIFTRLTSTIIRQVGDVKRMVDEFSNFARMPKPIFREDNLAEVLRQSVFLHEVAHQDIIFDQILPGDPLLMWCDRRLMAQAFTNIIKNAVEAIQRGTTTQGRIVVQIVEQDDRVIVSVTDNGVGLPGERESIMEPYVTTREGGTGLGLAIVKRIIEEHGGTLDLADAPGGGTTVKIVLEPVLLAALIEQQDAQSSTRSQAGRD